MSLLEEYEQELAMSSTQRFSDMLGHRDLTEDAPREQPIFKRHKIDFKPPDAITHLAISNNQMLMALRNKKLLRIDMSHPESPTEIDLTKALGDKNSIAKLGNLFIDPTGTHAILSFAVKDSTQYENFYLGPGNRLQPLSKFRGHSITAVGWNSLNRDRLTTSNILVGTSKGLIYETELLASDETKWISISNTEQFIKQCFDVGAETGQITAIKFHRFSTDNVFFILITTSNRLYQFVGSVSLTAEPPYFHNIFNTSTNEEFLDIPGKLGFSQLDFYYPDETLFPDSFAWFTDPGLYCGKIDVSPSTYSSGVVATETSLIPYGNDSRPHSNVSRKKIGMVLTKFHALVLFEDHVKVICVLSEEVIQEDTYAETFGQLRAITKDPIKKTIWVFADHVVYRYKIINEERNIWQVYLNKQDFAMAKQFSKQNPVKYDAVLCAEADHYFKKANYSKSASLYARSQKTFEEIALKFLQLGNEEALKNYIACKLDYLSERDATQVTLLVLWFFEIILNRMSYLRNTNQLGDDYSTLEAEFQSLLQQEKIKACIKKNMRAVRDLIASHGDDDCMVCFAREMDDYRYVMEHYVQRRKYMDALNIINNPQNIELVYEFAPVLINEIPSELVNVLIKLGPKLKVGKLIPSLLQECHSLTKEEYYSEAIRYLEHCMYELNMEDMVIANYLLALYAQVDQRKLQTYLEVKGDDQSMINYDLQYVLRICTELGLTKACIHLYVTMELFEEAIDLAITFDIKLAKNVANIPKSEELKRKLWLKVAKHVVLEQKDIKHVTELLKECPLLKIEDILPYFPDFVTIDHFKDAICASLREYNNHIEQLKGEMREATDNVEELRNEKSELRNKHVVVRTDNICSVCDFAVISRAFYVFPCAHMFHSDCLLEELKPHLKTSARSRVKELENMIASLSVVKPNMNGAVLSVQDGTSSPINANRDKLINELDEIIGAECIFCGEIMIRSIDKPFLTAEESYQAMSGWD